MEAKELLAMNLSEVNFRGESGNDVSFLDELKFQSGGGDLTNKIYTTAKPLDLKGGGLSFQKETTQWGGLSNTFFDFCPHNHFGHENHNVSFGKAFKLASVLMEKGLVKPMNTVEDFVKLVQAISDEI